MRGRPHPPSDHSTGRVHDGADLDASVADQRDPLRHAQGLIEALGVNQVVAGERLLGNRERAVGKLGLAGDRADRRGACGRVQAAGRGQQPGLLEAPVQRGADLLIIDDPLKNAEEAASRAIREKSWDWWRSTARTRLQSGGVVVLVMTRWHEDDLAGRLLQDEAERWTVLELPALAEDGDPLGRAPGEALCPQLFDEPELERTRRALGSYFWSPLYQQRPLPADGGVFRRSDFRYFQEQQDAYVLATDSGERRYLKQRCARIITCDPALSSKQTADYTALGLWAITERRELLLLDMVRERFEQPDQAGFIERYYEQHQPTALYVEAAAHGLGLCQELGRRGLAVFAVPAEADKVTRARGAVARYEAHDVYHRQGADWLAAYEQELCGFPQAAHDDQVDCFAYAARALPHISVGQPRHRERAKTAFAGLRDHPL
jgi:predicted phage terminase large subunit-like protein